MSGVVEQINKLLHSLNQKLPVGEDGAPFFAPLNKDTILEKASSLWNSLIESVKNNIRPEHMGAVREWLESTAKIFIDAFFGIFISVFLLASKEKCYAQVMRFRHAYLGDKFNQAITKFISIADRSFGGFLRGKLLDSCIVGCLVYVACLIFQIPYAILVAVIVGITDIVPVIGPFVGVIPTAIIILLTDPVKVIVFVLSILVIQQIDGNIIAPKILGENTGVSSLCVLISILVMGDLMGLVGMVLAVPLFATVIELGKLWMDKRLSAKGLSGDLDDYYAEDALPDLTAEEVPPSEYVAPEAAYTTVPSFANGEGNLTASEQLQLRTYALVKKHGSLTKLSDEELIQLAKEAMTDDTPDGDEPKSQSEGGSNV
jgi:predicted PurR-regulated permease PerM